MPVFHILTVAPIEVWGAPQTNRVIVRPESGLNARQTAQAHQCWVREQVRYTRLPLAH